MLDNPNVSLSDPASFDYLTNNVGTDAGINVSPKSVLRLPPVWQAVTMISGDIAKLPLDCYEKHATNGRIVASKHPAHKLVRLQASKNITALDCWQTFMVHALIWNNGYIFIDRLRDGTPIGLYNMLPDRTHPEIIKGELWYITETVRENGTPWLRPIPAQNCLHLRGISFDGIVALDLVESAKHSWACAIAAQKFEAKFFKNGVRAGGTLELPVTMSAPVRDKIEEGFKKSVGEDNWFKTVILREGAKFHQQTFDPQSAQIVELGEAKVRDTARWFNLAPSRLGLSDSVSYNSKSEDNRSYLDTTLDVWLQKIVAQCRLRLLTPEQQDSSSHYFEHNTGAILRLNQQQRYQSYAMGFNKWLTRDDIREMENMPSSGPDGKKFGPIPGAAVATGGSDKGGNDTARGPAARHELHAKRRLVFTLGDHARKKAANPKAFLEFVDSGLSAHRSRADTINDGKGILEQALTTLRTIAETKSANDLQAAVDTAMTELELSVD